MYYFLQQVTLGSDEPLSITIEDDMQIGSKTHIGLQNYNLMSKLHASFLRADDNNLFIKDLGSLHGTYVNHKRISGNIHRLKINDMIGFGSADTSEGFVCVLCTDTVKYEVFDISSDDEPNETLSKQVPLHQNDRCSVITKVDHIKSETIESKFNSELQPASVHENLSTSQNSMHHTNETKILSNAHFKNITFKENNATNLSSEHSSISTSNNKGNVSESHSINYLKCFEKKRCCVHLIRVDSKYFPWPPDVKISSFAKSSHLDSQDDEFHLNVISRKKRKRKLCISSSSDESCDTSVPDPQKSVVYQQVSKNNCDVDALKNNCDNKGQKFHLIEISNIAKKKIISRASSTEEDMSNSFSCVTEMPCHLPQVCEDKFDSNSVKSSDSKDFQVSKSNRSKFGSVPSFETFDLAKKSCESYDVNSSKKSNSSNDDFQGKVDVKVLFGTNINSSDSKTAFITPIQHSSVDNKFRYSQVDEIIYISDDDDDYLDFKSSHNVCIKSEPPDDRDDYNTIFPDELENNIVVDSLENCDESETVEAIEQYLKDTEKSNLIDNPPLETRREEERNNTNCFVNNKFDDDCDAKSNSSIESDSKIMYPSQSYRDKSNFNVNSEKAAGSALNIKEHDERNFQNKGDRKSAGKILFTEPKPMSYRPKKVRGRGEWFHEQSSSVTNHDCSKVTEKKRGLKSKSLKSKKLSGWQKQKESTSKKSSRVSVETDNVQNKSQNLQSYRIPRKSTDENEHSVKKSISKSVGNAIPNNKSTLVDTHTVSKRKRSPVKRRSENYGSRLESLVSTMQNDTSKVKSKARNKIPSTVVGKNKTFCEKKQPVCETSVILVGKHTNSIKIAHSSTTAIPTSTTGPTLVGKDKIIGETKKPFGEKSEIMTPNASNKNRSVHNPSSSEPGKPFPQNASNSFVVQQAGNCKDPRIVGGQRAVFTDEGKEMLCKSSGQTMRTTALISPSPHLVPSIIPDERRISRPFVHINFLILLERILNMQVSWLQEQDKVNFPPPEVSKGASSLPLHYDSFITYISSICPMIMLEIWDMMYKKSKNIFESQRILKKFYFSVQSCNSKNGMTELSCTSIVNDEVSYYPCDGTLVILDIKTKERNVYSMFGYINSHKVEEIRTESISTTEWKKLPEEWMHNARLCTFSVFIRKKEITVELGKIMKANGICDLKSKLLIANALHYLKSSKLLKDILQPSEETFSLKCLQASPSTNYSCGQKQIIRSVTSVIRRKTDEPKIILLQGPPGTGKTHTIVGIIENLVNRCKSAIKILVTAPSNVAIDEIGCRLIESKKRSSWRDCDLKFVRVGKTAEVSRKMLPYTLEEKAASLYSEAKRNRARYAEKEIEKIKGRIVETLKQGRMNSENLIVLKKYLSLLQSNKWRETQSNCVTDMNYEMEVLKDANIVLSTLNSCRQDILTRVFKPNSNDQFSCCIVDEATQCTEPEVLQLLMYGINKLILVGDQQQLPATVNSKFAADFGFERSLFERFHCYFMEKNQLSPVLMLTEQFRMHSEICYFPSKHFYAGKLFTGPDIDIRYELFPLRPYIVLDILESQESTTGGSKAKSIEAEIAFGICSQLLEMNAFTSIGIITPYKVHKSVYVDALSQNPHHYKAIEVNTVDSFQGREKDVIVVCCLRSNPSGSIGFLACKKALNVAITRARQCLIICGHLSSLMQNADWECLINNARERNLCISVRSPKEVPIIFSRHLIKNAANV